MQRINKENQLKPVAAGIQTGAKIMTDFEFVKSYAGQEITKCINTLYDACGYGPEDFFNAVCLVLGVSVDGWYFDNVDNKNINL